MGYRANKCAYFELMCLAHWDKDNSKTALTVPSPRWLQGVVEAFFDIKGTWTHELAHCSCQRCLGFFADVWVEFWLCENISALRALDLSMRLGVELLIVCFFYCFSFAPSKNLRGWGWKLKKNGGFFHKRILLCTSCKKCNCFLPCAEQPVAWFAQGGALHCTLLCTRSWPCCQWGWITPCNWTLRIVSLTQCNGIWCFHGDTMQETSQWIANQHGQEDGCHGSKDPGTWGRDPTEQWCHCNCKHQSQQLPPATIKPRSAKCNQRCTGKEVVSSKFCCLKHGCDTSHSNENCNNKMFPKVTHGLLVQHQPTQREATMPLQMSSIIGSKGLQDNAFHNHPTEGVGGMSCCVCLVTVAWLFIQMHSTSMPWDPNPKRGAKKSLKQLMHVSKTLEMSVSELWEAQKMDGCNEEPLPHAVTAANSSDSSTASGNTSSDVVSKHCIAVSIAEQFPNWEQLPPFLPRAHWGMGCQPFSCFSLRALLHPDHSWSRELSSFHLKQAWWPKCRTKGWNCLNDLLIHWWTMKKWDQDHPSDQCWFPFFMLIAVDYWLEASGSWPEEREPPKAWPMKCTLERAMGSRGRQKQ